ncbi:hypothetical protein Tco_0550222 [Tanacetum coccineum]
MKFMLNVVRHQASVSPTPLLEKVGKKKKSQTMTKPKPKSQGPEASGVPPKLTKGKKKTKPKKTSLIQTTLKLTHEKEPSEATDTSQSVSSGHVPSPQDTKGNIQPAVTGPHNSPPKNENGKSKLLPKAQNTDPQDSEVADPDHNKGKTSSEVELDTQPPIQSFKDFKFLMEDFKVDLKELSDEEVYEVGDEMEDAFPLNTEPESSKLVKEKAKKSKESELSLNPSNSESSSASLSFKPYDNYMPITGRFLARTLQGFSKVLYAQVAEDNWEKHEEAILHQDKAQHVEEINKILTNLKEVQDVGKDDPAMNSKEVVNTYKQISTNLVNLTELIKEANILGLRNSLEAIQNIVNALAARHETLANSYRYLAWNVSPRLTKIKLNQESIKSDLASLKDDTSDIKTMMVEIFYAFKGQPFSASSCSVPQPTFAITNVNKIVGGSSAHIASISLFVLSPKPSPERKDEEEKETPYHTEGVQEDMTIIPTIPYPTTLITLEAQVTELTAQPITKESRSSQITPRVAKGKGIVGEDDPSPPKLVKDSREVRIDPDGPVLIDREVDGKIILIPNDQLQIYLDKKEQTERAMNEAEVQIKGTKDFSKHQDAHLKVLTRARSEKLKYFNFGDVGISEWDELSVIIPKKKNKVISELMTSLSDKYEILKKIPSELRLNLALPLLE